VADQVLARDRDLRFQPGHRSPC